MCVAHPSNMASYHISSDGFLWQLRQVGEVYSLVKIRTGLRFNHYRDISSGFALTRCGRIYDINQRVIVRLLYLTGEEFNEPITTFTTMMPARRIVTLVISTQDHTYLSCQGVIRMVDNMKPFHYLASVDRDILGIHGNEWHSLRIRTEVKRSVDKPAVGDMYLSDEHIISDCPSMSDIIKIDNETILSNRGIHLINVITSWRDPLYESDSITDIVNDYSRRDIGWLLIRNKKLFKIYYGSKIEVFACQKDIVDYASEGGWKSIHDMSPYSDTFTVINKEGYPYFINANWQIVDADLNLEFFA